MRNPRNETLASDSSDVAHDGRGTDPVRTCILTRKAAPQDRLIRLALGPDGAVLPDVRAKAPGRGAWIGVDRAALDTALAKGKLHGALARAFKTNTLAIPDDLGERTAAALERNALDMLGLVARAGQLLTGSDRIREAARGGAAALLLHAADSAEDGRRKLDQALRVGMDAEGSGLRGLVIPADRTILGSALGRENTVHVAVVDERAAKRVSGAISRWMEFLGPGETTEPCSKGSQGGPAMIEEDKGQ